MERNENLCEGFSLNSLEFDPKTQNNSQNNDSTVYYDQQEDDEEDTNFVVVSTLVGLYFNHVFVANFFCISIFKEKSIMSP